MPVTTTSSSNPYVGTITTTTDDATGLLLERVLNFYSGVVAVMDYDAGGIVDGRRDTVSYTDPDDVKPWATRLVTYAENGLTSETRVTTRDDGLVITETYTSAHFLPITNVLIEDTANIRTYDTVEKSFEFRGALSQSVTTRDDGKIIVRGDDTENVLTGTDADEIFQTLGGADTIIFEDQNGMDRVSGFNTAEDTLDLRAHGISSILDLAGRVSQAGLTTIITLSDGDSVRLNNVSVNELTDDNFISGGADGFENGMRLDFSYLLPDIDTVYENETVTLGDGPDTTLSITSSRRLVEFIDDQIIITFDTNVGYAEFSGGYSGVRVLDEYDLLLDITGARVNETESTGILAVNPFQPDRPVTPDVQFDADTIWVNFDGVNQGRGTVVIDIDFA